MDQRLNWSLVLLVFILASHITDVLARHHHIKLRHARHRRQHGESYLPASFVSDTDEEESGTWGPWSTPSSCSRSCGGGVAHQTRICQDIDEPTQSELCTGAKKRFFSCNVQDCPEPTQDFRAEQCAEFNNVSIEGVYYDWIPYTGGPNKCELNCMPRGQRFFYRHKPTVTDGTPCTAEKNDVCVQGKCRPVGCDMMLGSDAKEDRCRECGGDGSACNTVQGLLDMDDLQVGYNDILLIPEGATNIDISEVRPSSNYLAIRNASGHYYLNGNWRIDFPRSLRFAGSVFHYERRPKEFSAADIINTLGPTNEAIYIVLLSQDKNVGVNYEYSIPKRFSQQSNPDTYTWVVEEFSDCSVTCGGGIQSRLVRCVKRGDNEEADASLCDQQLEPDSTQACGVEPCPPEWVVKDWGPCSKQCGSGGEQSREVQCEQIISGGIPSLVDDLRCLDLIGPKDIVIQECNKDVQCPQWHIGPWKPCDRLCGKGKQTRKVTCYRKEEGKIIVMGDSACEEERPESEKHCELRPCAGVDWVVSKWSGCDDKCGLTQETRTTSCVTLDGTVYPDSQCHAETKPELVRECSTQEKCAFQWYATQWSECSVKCGTGIQTRKVFCGTSPSSSEGIKEVDDEKCDAAKKYNTTKDCVAEIEECKGEWFAGPWTECSKLCGGGEKTRKVICMKDNKVVPIKGNCHDSDVMFSFKDCNQEACNEDETTPVEPGKSDILKEDDEEECEEYEDDGFEPVASGLDTAGLQNDEGIDIDASPLSFSSDIKLSGYGLEDLMLGDDPRGDIDGPSDDYEEGSGGYNDSSDEDWSEGSGSEATSDSTSSFSTSETTSDSTSSFSTSDTESTESTETGSTDTTESTVSDTPSTTKSQGTTEKSFPFFNVEETIPEPEPTPPQEKQPPPTTSSTSDSTTESETSESLSTGETSEISSSSTVSDLERTGPTTAWVSSSSAITDASSGSGSDTTVLSSSETLESSSSDTTESSSSDTTESSSSDTTESSSSDTTESSSLDTTESSSSDTTESSSSDTTVLSSSETPGSPSSETTGSSNSDTTESSSSDTTVSSTSETLGQSSSETPGSSSSDTTVVSSSETPGSSSSDTSASSDSDTTESSSSDTTESSSSDTTESSSSDTTESSSSDTTVLSSSETPGSSSSDTTQSSSSETVGQSSSDTTVLSSSETPESSSSDTTESSSSDTTVLSSSETPGSSSSDTTIVSSSETPGSSSSETTGSSSSDTTESSSSDTTESTSTGTTQSSSSETIGQSSSDTTVLSSSETPGSSSSDTTESSSSVSTVSSSSETTESSSSAGTTESSSSQTTESSSSQTTESSSSQTTESSSSVSTVSSSSETTGSSSSAGTTESSSSQTTESSSSVSTVSSSLETTVSSSSAGTTESSSSQTTESSSSQTTESSSSPTTESSSSQTTESSSLESTVSSSSDTTTSGSSVATATTESSSSTDTTGSESTISSEGSTETEETSESGITTVSGETEITGDTTDSEITSDTTESGVTETDEDLDTTEQSHITDIWSTASPTGKPTSKRPRKCKPRKPKTCKSSPFGCCSDGVKAAKGPFEKGCPVPKTCKETEYGCCPDGVSPATGADNEGCPDSHCSQTLFGCCPDNDTPAEGNDYEGCPVPCNESEFGCCPDGETPAAGKDDLGCCNATTHGCCPDGIKSASGPDGEGCEEEATSTITTPEDKVEITTELTTTSEVEDTSTSEVTTTTVSEAEESCTNSPFGCCPDNKTTATGESYEGCDIINTENCTASYYGCCPDGVSAALGPNSEGCHMDCENSTFGCCDDRSTPAHGPNKEGCCLATPYGCCPDNTRHAQGPALYGCGCQYSRYGCCPDNTTTARGPNNEGCACQDTPHGCCPNRIATASGPNFEGCACHTYQFGCCPDGISVAKGPQRLGCGCENTEFKCCSDGITPAKGENYAGCTCDSSKYGCCPDGAEEAQGENFEGCLTVPSSPGAACALERDRGSCSDFSVRWFFDTEYGGCSRFWYGGCEGNENRFKSQEECKAVCVEPKGRDACFLPKISGPCEEYHPTWYYDTERQQCGQFIYKGCLGNANKFKTRDECEELCVIPDDIDACEQPKEVGPCEGNFTRWYFSKETDSCEEFAYGGCKGNKNNFRTQISCQQQCLTPGRSRVQDVCALEKEPGPCPGSLLRWYYDSKRKSCRQFVYGGCKGNGNKFRTYAACEQRCPIIDSCSLPREEGSCTEKHARWFFDQSENRCMPFYYTGCGGNRNNYETVDACDSSCPSKIEQNTCLLPALLGECYNYTQRWYYDSYEERCRQFYYGGCGGNGNNFETEYDCTNRCKPSPTTPAPEIREFRTEFCFLGEDYGSCNEASIKWFYDSRDGVCKRFQYGGCAGNGNKFDTVEECENRCGNVQDLCGLPSVVGPCRAAIPKFYYDSNTDLCQEFIYGGCQGNKNNFDDKESCEQRCRKSTDAPITTVRTTPSVTTEIVRTSSTCSLPMDVGPCDNDTTAYYYDARVGGCQAFIYGGCEGNANRFQTEEQCERLCGSFQGQDVCNIPSDPGPCLGAFPKYYYDPNTRGCHEFLYGGCDGNANRFTSAEECESICVHREELPAPGNRTATSNLEICNEPVSVGSCSVGSYKRFYYSDERLNCIAFIYTGCGGNRNRFKNYNSCMKTCSSSINEVDIGPDEPESKDPCLAARAECSTIRCPYGIEDYVDAQNCQHCRCADPCRTEICPEGSRCAITLVAREGDSIGYQSVCRAILKPGNCPKVSNATSCEEECSSDADCTDDLKCCASGCGSSCLKPAATEPVTTPAPEISFTDPYPGAEPAVIQQPEEPRVRAEEGGYVVLLCTSTGNPRPSITWRRGVTLIDNTLDRHSISVQGSLQIVNLYRTDEGIYTCTADNHLAAPVRIQYELIITEAAAERAPEILGEPDYHVTVTLNSPAVLPCNAIGWPRPLVNWWHEEQLLPMSVGSFHLQRDNSLKIHRVDLVNLGVYTCQAYNGFQKPTSWSVTLQAPGPVYNLNSENQKYAKYLVGSPRRPVSSTVTPRYPYRPETTKAPATPKHAPLYPDEKPYTPPVVIDPSHVIVPGPRIVPVQVNVSAERGPFPERSEFNISCHVGGFPIPRVVWFKDDTPIQPNNRIMISNENSLIISDADKSDSGRYRCQAGNEYTSAADSIDIEVAGIYIHPNCKDTSFYAKCDLIVKAGYCHHKYYARFCCRSCTEAGQLPARGPHINETRRKRRSILSFL